MDQPSPDFAFRSKNNEPKEKRRHWWIWVIVLLAFGLLFYWVIQTHNQSQQAIAGGGRGGGGRLGAGGPIPVTYATATKGTIGVYLDAIGTVTPTYMDTITAQVTGVITAVHYREGQFVHKGDPLIDIDSRTYEAELEQAQGTLQRDQSLLAEAEMDLKRYQEAWTKNAIPRQTLEDQDKLVLQERGTVRNDEGVVKFNQVQVSYCHLTSPIDGRVGLRLTDPGNLVTANSTTALVVVAQTTPITVIFTLPEDSLPQVLAQMRGGKALTVQAFDRTQQKLLDTGKLLTVDNQIDTTTGTVKLRAAFPNATGMLFPNQFVNTRMLVKTLDNQTLIASSAVQHNGAQDFVYVIQNPDSKGAKAVIQNVKAGISDNGNTVIVKGIAPGTVVADSSFQKLVTGASVYQSKVALPSTDTTGDDTP